MYLGRIWQKADLETPVDAFPCDLQNSDAGTMSPFEHGEVFVLNDGGEVSTQRVGTGYLRRF